MKTLILITLLSLPVVSFCQLEGVYKSNTEYGLGTHISFRPDGLFDYRYSTGCGIGNSIGFGKYSLEGDKLTLLFDISLDTLNSITRKKKHYKVQETETLADEILLNVQVSDLENDNEPVILSSVILKDTADKTICYGETDLDGRLTLKTPSSAKEAILMISYYGYKSYEIPVFLNKNYEIEAYCVGPSKYENLLMPTIISTGETIEFKVEREDGEIFMTRIDYPNARRVKFIPTK